MDFRFLGRLAFRSKIRGIINIMSKFFKWLRSVFVTDSEPVAPAPRAPVYTHVVTPSTPTPTPRPVVSQPVKTSVMAPVRTSQPVKRNYSGYRYSSGNWYDNSGLLIDPMDYLLWGLIFDNQQLAINSLGYAVTDDFGNPIYVDASGQTYDSYGNSVGVNDQVYNPTNYDPSNFDPNQNVDYSQQSTPTDQTITVNDVVDDSSVMGQVDTLASDTLPTPDFNPSVDVSDPLPQPADPEPSYAGASSDCSSSDSSSGSNDSGSSYSDSGSSYSSSDSGSSYSSSDSGSSYDSGSSCDSGSSSGGDSW